MTNRETDLPPELVPVADRLRAERPRLTALELDELGRRIRARPHRSRRITLMKSRMAITMMLVLGLLLSTAGAGLALQGGSGSGSAAGAQYPPSTPPQVLGEEDTSTGLVPSTSTPRTTDPCTGDGSGTAGTNGSATCAQAPRQIAAQGGGSGQLPFTGFAAIPVLIGGLALLATGFALRRRTAGDVR